MRRAATRLATKKRKALHHRRARKGEPEKHAFYRAALRRLNLSGIPYLVGGAFALESITGIFHHTKDLDVFVRRADLERTLALLRDELDCRTQLTYPHWLAKAFWREHFIDVIFSTGNGLAEVDDTWLERGLPAEALEVPVRLCPLEETIWTKAFVMERERYDGADIAHLILTCGRRIDWPHLLRLFDSHWAVLLSHLVLFDYIYPAAQDIVPPWVLRELSARFHNDNEPREERLCRGPLLSRGQYMVDIEDWKFLDGRIAPFGRMTPEAARAWSAEADQVPRIRRGATP